MDKKERLIYLDAFRGLSALWVMLFHYNHYYNKDYAVPFWLQNTLENGYLGVAFFFVISAFSMGLSSDRHKEDSIIYFYVRRFFRIAPLYYILLIIGIVFLYNIYSYTGLVWNILFAFNFFVRDYFGMVWAGWTIGIEMPFYLLFPFIWMIYKRFIYSGLVVISLMFSIVIYYHYGVFKDTENGLFWYLSFFRFLPVFILGLWVYVIYSKLKVIGKASNYGNVVFLLGFILLILYIGEIFMPDFRLESFYSGFFFACMLLGASVSNYNKILDTKFLKWLGRNSYSIYLLHPIVLNKFTVFSYNSLKYRTQSVEIAYYASMLFTILITCLLSEIAWRVIEKPGVELGNYIVKVLKNRRTNNLDFKGD